MANNDSIDHDHGNMSTCSSSTLSSTTVKFYCRCFSDPLSIHVIDQTTGIKRSNNNNNSIDLTNLSVSKINHNDNDNQTHSILSISSSISSSSFCCIIKRPSSISLLPVVFPEFPAYDRKLEEKRSSFYPSKYPTTMVKKKTTEQEISDIASGKIKPSAWTRRAPAVLNLSSRNNNNNIGNKINNKKKHHNTKK